jgi:CheY-like chemotaxis protein
VEDIPANVQIVQHFLDEFGFRSDVASDGRHALERISSGLTYDAVLMDIQMPGMDGREATRLIRRYEHDHHQVPHQIIAITAHAMATDREKCFAAGMNDYLSKPFDPKVLEQKLVRAIAARRKAETQSSMSVVEDQNSPPDDFRSADGGGDV